MGPILEALRDERGACPEIDVLLRADPETLGEDDHRVIARHLDLCPICAAIFSPAETEVDDLTWRRTAQGLDQRSKPWRATERGARGSRFRRPLLIAATLVIALGAATIWRQTQIEPEMTGPISSQRGPSIQAVAPVGSLDQLTAFSWRTILPLELDYRLELESDGALLWHADTNLSSLDPPADLVAGLERGRSYRWRVLGQDQGNVVAESNWVEFTLVP